MSPNAGEIRNIGYFCGAKEHINKPLHIPVKQKKRSTPSEITFFWNGPKNNPDSYHIIFNEKIYEWEKPNDGIYFQLYFNDIEIIDVFQQLGSKNRPIKLELCMEELDGKSAFFSVQFSNGKKSILLKRIVFKTVGNSFHFNEIEFIRHFEQGRLRLSFEAALTYANALPSFFQYSQHIAENSAHSKEYNYQLADHTTKLLINHYKKGNVKSSKLIFHHYVDKLLPHAGISNKTMDVASNGLALCINEQDEKIKVIDLGCGTGTISKIVKENYPSSIIHCVDIAENMIEIAKYKLSNYPDITYENADLSDYSFTNSYDVILSSLTLHHLVSDDDKINIYTKIFHALNPNGVFYNADNVIGSNDTIQENNMYHWRQFMQKTLPLEEIEQKWIKRYEEEDRPAKLSDQLNWLKDIGFVDIDVIWKYYNFAVYGGLKK